LTLASTTLLISLAWLATVGFVVVRGTEVTRLKPVWLLEHEMHGPGGGAALAELTRRMRDGRLSVEHANRLADRALAAQSDRSRPWSVAWGTFIERAHECGVLAPGKWEQYFQNAVRGAVSVHVPAPVRRSAVPVTLSFARARFSGSDVQVHCVGRLRIDGTHLITVPEFRFSLTPDVEECVWQVNIRDVERPPDGIHRVTIELSRIRIERWRNCPPITRLDEPIVFEAFFASPPRGTGWLRYD